MQMGRWFGYRDGYRDLVRLWCSLDSKAWYADITNATEQLRESVTLMAKQKLTPKDFGLRVLSHPKLLVTAKNKMQSGKEIEVKISFSGQLKETYVFGLDKKINQDNKELTISLLSNILTYRRKSPLNQDQHVFMNDVPGYIIVDFLKNYQVNNLNGDWSSDLFRRYLDEVYESDLFEWDVCIFNKKNTSEDISPELSNLVEKNIHLQYRTIFYRAGIEKFSKAFFTNGSRKLSQGSSIQTIGLNPGELRVKPILVIHAIKAISPKDNTDSLPEKLSECIGKVFYGCSVMLPETKNEVKAISYIVNQRWFQDYMPEIEDDNIKTEVEEL
jgi:hypothetical protein